MKQIKKILLLIILITIIYPSFVFSKTTEVSIKVNKLLIDIGSNGKIAFNDKTYNSKLETFVIEGTSFKLKIIPNSNYEIYTLNYSTDSDVTYNKETNELIVNNINSDINANLSFKEIIDNNQDTNNPLNINPIIVKTPIKNTEIDNSNIDDINNESNINNNSDNKLSLIKTNNIKNKELNKEDNNLEAYNYGKGQIVVLTKKINNKELITLENTKDTINNVLTKQDLEKVSLGEDAYIYLDIDYIKTNEVNTFDKYTNNNNYKYIDLNLYKVIGNDKNKIYKLDNKLTITINLDKELINKNINYRIITNYNNKYYTFKDLDNNKETITIKTNIFDKSIIVWNKNYYWTIIPIIISIICLYFIIKEKEKNKKRRRKKRK